LDAKYKVAWLSLEEGDDDVSRFLTYFVAALQTIETDIGQGVSVALQSPGEVNVEVLLNTTNRTLSIGSRKSQPYRCN